MNKVDRIVAAGFVIAWSGGFIGIELGTQHASPLALLTWRFLVLAVPAVAWLACRRGRFRRRDIGVHVIIGLGAQVGYLSGISFAAQLGVAPGVVSLIAALQPIVMAIAAWHFLGEGLRAAQVVGLLIGLVGVGFVVAADLGGGAPLWAFALPLGAMLGIVATTVLERRVRPDSLGPTDALAVQFLVGAVVFTALTAIGGQLAPPAAGGFWAGVALTVVLAGLGGYGLYWAVVRRSGPNTASSLLYLTPPTTLLWAWLMFGETLDGAAWIGLGLTAAGVTLALRRGRSREAVHA
ncbi:DMT family transporter [Glycomyces sp. TRM65418]|uniref:DMT family transporter n=1 Tax=Glycomyces sp. TRM65418 TaxID=2867006 RepID=UPI001CE67F84|nr:DMT family transporter [Glycomyces sp. TRM65418]MCC3763361.1 DMT family transporter [Glycomyces sp. TRM65418]QZD57353.1 DMT family transporter [Glycomyces sp. TRM65418]